MDSVTVHVDGGSRGNPGPSAAAAVATDPQGQEIADRARYLGEVTNNVAEYRAVQLGLELARELGASSVEVVNDSQVVASQIDGSYKVKKDHLKPLHAETLEALDAFDGWSIRNVRREENTRADALVNDTLDRETAR